ncbi:hypothetical protein DFJ74DRAFT_658658 [Hyaloraphidium curvatum]|nr:hypothetical protein DFJ74DRAFT_658658 [Hyaloraphidium curvatum]
MPNLVLLVELEIAPGNESACTAAMLKNAAASREEPGCLQFDVLVDPENVRKVRFYEVYKDADALGEHQKTEHFKEWLEKGVPLLASRQRTTWTRIAP